jgi:hypothetical protein
MRKFWIILLAAGLIMAFSMPVFGAVGGADVKFSGSYYVQGVYEENHALKKIETGGNPSMAYYAQRLRLQTEFKVAEGLNFVTRIDALEKKWGDQTWYASTAYDVDNRPAQIKITNSTATATYNYGVRTQENIEFVRAYADFKTAIGQFMVGYQNFVAWGTDFGDTYITRPGIKYVVPVGPAILVAAIEKVNEKGCVGYGSSAVCGSQQDVDYNIYDLGAIYKWKGGEAGLLVQYGRDASARASTLTAGGTTQTYLLNSTKTLLVFDPYVKMTFGPVYFEAEAAYATGKLEFENDAPYKLAGGTNVDIEGLGIYLHGKMDFAPAYAGFQFAYIRGDDPVTPKTKEGGIMASMLAGQAFNPCLLLWNDDITTWGYDYYGHVPANAAAAKALGAVDQSVNTFMDNVWFYQVYGGFKPTPKLDVRASFTYAYADQKPTGTGGVPSAANPRFISADYGTEFDLTATYKIYDNLSYMVGGAYLWTGDYFKGTLSTNKIDNDYLITHKLTLSF